MTAETKSCPMCGESVLAVARKCRHCGEYFNPADRPRDVPSATERALLPVGRPGSAIAAGYLALFGVIPLFGLPLAVLAIVFGIFALKNIKRDPELSGKGRAWFGIILGGLTVALTAFLIIFAVVKEMSRH